MTIKEEVMEMKKEVEEVKEQSFAMELLSDYKKANKRQFIIILVILVMWFITIGYLVYILNDIGVETTTQEIEGVETTESINKIIDDGLNTNNLDNLYKLSKIKHMAKEDEKMNNYGNYGNYNGRGTGYGNYGRGNYGDYGEYGNYGRRGMDRRYRGDEYLDRMSGEYGRYMENRSRYGASEETDKSFHYMVEAYKDFSKYLFEEAETPQQKQMLREAMQQSMM